MSFPPRINSDYAPLGAMYAVVVRDEDAIAWARDVAGVLEAMRKLDVTHRCDVVRIWDNAVVWPWFTRGGES